MPSKMIAFTEMDYLGILLMLNGPPKTSEIVLDKVEKSVLCS